MRIIHATVFASLLALVAVPAFAGDLTLSNGKSQWQSTRCTEPVLPPALAGLSSDTPASKLNELMGTYNGYADAMQGYMNCVSKEADDDMTSSNQIIAQSAQGSIGDAQQKVSGLRAQIQPKKN